MKAVIFDGAKEGDLAIDAIETSLINQLSEHGWEVETLRLRTLQIAACLGCFGCWIKTPGDVRALTTREGNHQKSHPERLDGVADSSYVRRIFL